MYKEAIDQVNNAKLYDGVKEMLEKLHEKGINLFVMSSDTHSTLLPEAESGKIHDLFVEIVANIHHKDEALTELVKKHSLNPLETLYVGDTTGDINSGKEAGIKTAAVTWGFHPEEKLIGANPNFIFNSICDIMKLFDPVCE